MCILHSQHSITQFRLAQSQVFGQLCVESAQCPGHHVSLRICLLIDVFTGSQENLVQRIPLWNLFSVKLNLILVTWPISNIYRLFCILSHPNGICKRFPITIIVLSNTQHSVQPQPNIHLLQIKTPLPSCHYILAHFQFMNYVLLPTYLHYFCKENTVKCYSKQTHATRVYLSSKGLELRTDFSLLCLTAYLLCRKVRGDPERSRNLPVFLFNPALVFKQQCNALF